MGQHEAALLWQPQHSYMTNMGVSTKFLPSFSFFSALFFFLKKKSINKLRYYEHTCNAEEQARVRNEYLGELVHALEPNLLSPNSELRLASLELLSCMEEHRLAAASSAVNIYRACLDIERVPIDLQVERGKKKKKKKKKKK